MLRGSNGSQTEHPAMNKSQKYFVVVVLSFIALLVEAVSGFVLWLVLPQGLGYRGGQGTVSFLFDRATWLAIHDWFAVAFLVLMGMHIGLHWRWIARMARSLWAR
jgi:hypothetical protein